MKRFYNKSSIDYLSLILVVSFLWIHNIIFVFFGISIAIFSIYKIDILKTIPFINTKPKESVTKEIREELDLINIEDLDDDSKLKLAQQIDELGFIPSIKSNIDKKAA